MFAVVVILHAIYWSVKFPDYVDFLRPWLLELRERGPSIIGTPFAYANYHPPYLYLLWFFSLFIPDNLSVVKLLSLLGDVALAGGVYVIIRQVLPRRPYKAAIGAGIAMLLPTVMINSAMWGQCDALYSAFLMYAVGFVLRRKLGWAWVMFAVAIAFKTQGLFLLPFMAYVSWCYRHWKGMVYGMFTGGALLGMPLLFGITLQQLVPYYMKDFQPMWGRLRLSWWCPNLMSWFPNSQYDLWRAFGLVLFALLLVAACYFGWRRWFASSSTALLALAATSCMTATFVLPQVHGRYYFPAEILLFTYVFVTRGKWQFVVAMQAATVIALLTYFATDASDDMTPYRLLSLPMGAVLGYLIFMVVRHSAHGIIKKTS